jgi:dihydrofolate reductase
MRRLVLSSFVSLDGVSEAPETWQNVVWNDECEQFARKLLFGSDTLLLGRRTYELFVGSWPYEEGDFADRLNNLPKYIVSNSLTEVGWTNCRLLTGDLREAIGELKNQDGQDILIYGSMDLAQTLMRENLIDDYHIWVHPVIAGGGPSLFRSTTEVPPLRLVDVTVFSSGVVVHSYQAKEAGTE